MFSALRYRNYRFFWVAMLCSVLGQNMEWIALSWLVLQLTNSPLSIGLTGLAQAAPNITLTLVGGAIADRFDRRRLLMLTQALTALLYLLLATLVGQSLVQVWHVGVFAFLLGCVRAFDQPSRQALLPHMIPRDEIPNAVALGNLVWQLPRLVGPAVAGLLISFFGVAPTLYVASLGFVAAATLFGSLRIDRSAATHGERGLLRDMLDGLDFVRRNEIFSALIGMTFFNSVFGMSYVILLPVFARNVLGVGSGGYGFLQTATALGALAGTLAMASLGGSAGRGWQVVSGAAAFGSLLVGFALSPWYPLSLGLIFFMGLTNQVYMTAINTVLQLNLPDQLRGRVLGLYGLTWSLVPLGGTIGGTVAELTGAPAAVALGGCLVAATAVFIGVAMPRVRRLE